jgi:hypothetical protein
MPRKIITCFIVILFMLYSFTAQNVTAMHSIHVFAKEAQGLLAFSGRI